MYNRVDLKSSKKSYYLLKPVILSVKKNLKAFYLEEIIDTPNLIIV